MGIDDFVVFADETKICKFFIFAQKPETSDDVLKQSDSTILYELFFWKMS